MKNKLFMASVLLCAILIPLTACQSSYESVTEISDSCYEEFAADTDGYLEKIKFQGAVLVSVGDDIIFAKGYGLSDEKDPDSLPLDIHSTFEIGSMTKQMTAACILGLEEKGLLDTSDSLEKYFPEYAYGQDITIDMLLHMRSGLDDPINSPRTFFPEDTAEELISAELENRPVPEDIVMQYFYDVPLRGKPGERMDYCNMNYYLLACIVEQVSGESFDDYIRKNIFDKCGMTESNTDFQGTTSKAYDSAGRYYSIPKPLAKGSGEVNSSVIDLFKWNRALYTGDILREEALEKMLRSEKGYACGLFSGGGTALHGGSTDVFNSYGIYYMQDEMLIIVLENRPIERSNSTSIGGNIRKYYLGMI